MQPVILSLLPPIILLNFNFLAIFFVPHHSFLVLDSDIHYYTVFFLF